MKAIEAHNITSHNINNLLIPTEYNLIMTRIKYAISIGKFWVWEEDMYKENIRRFKEDGYKVRRHYMGYKISWFESLMRFNQGDAFFVGVNDASTKIDKRNNKTIMTKPLKVFVLSALFIFIILFIFICIRY